MGNGKSRIEDEVREVRESSPRYQDQVSSIDSKLPPGYKRTEVGVIPEDWKVIPIGKAGAILGGRQRSPDRAGTLCKYLRVANVFDGYIDIDDVLEMPFTKLEKDQFHLMSGDILLNEGQSLDLVGRSAIYYGFPSNCCFQNTLIRFRAYKDTSPEFVQIVFQHYLRTGVFASIAMQTTSIAHLGAGRLAALKMPLPSLPEQNTIAEVLADADALVAALDKVIAKKHDFRTAAMHTLLTGEMRLPGFQDKWKVRSIDEIAYPTLNKNSIGENLPVLACSKHLGFIDSLSYFKNQVFSEDNTTYKIIQRGQIGYPSNHIEEGSIGLQDLYDIALVSPIYIVFSVREGVHSYFLHRLLKLDIFQQIFKTVTNASIDRRGSLRWPEFSRINVRLPSFDEQKAIVEVLTDMDAEVSALEAQRDKAKLIKEGMMDALLTGKIRLVSSATKPAAKARTRTPVNKTASQNRGHNRTFNDAVLISALARHFGSEQFPLGRMRYTKLSYLFYRHTESHATGYIKKAAGPYNPNTKYGGAEAVAKKRGYLKVHMNGRLRGFISGEKNDEALAYFEKWYGAEGLAWLEQFRKKSNDILELWATVDMAMQDLIASGQEVSLDAVKSVIRSDPEWLPKLDRNIFSDENIASAIEKSRELFG